MTRFIPLLLIVLFFAPCFPADNPEPTWPAGEFAQRRQMLMKEVKDGIILLFSAIDIPGNAHFRQDNDFYYYTGNEDPQSVLVMIPERSESYLFQPQQSPSEIKMGGTNLLGSAPAASGFTSLLPLHQLDEFLARKLGYTQAPLYLRLHPADDAGSARGESFLEQARQARLHYNAAPSIDQFRIARLRERFTHTPIRDITPLIDAQRRIKTPAEIAILRCNGQLSARAVRAAMLASAINVKEYVLEAAAIHQILLGGARGPAFTPIVASGPNTCILHYDRNDRTILPGDLILMDFGADLHHLAMDISRTWPANGTFSPEQRRIYQTVLEIQKACLAAFKPGVTSADVRNHVSAVLKAKGIDDLGIRIGLGHGVGLSTHDPGIGDGPLLAGMVMAIEPMVYYPEKGLGIRIEDTVLITETGYEVLTAEVPKEIDEIERLLAQRRKTP